MYRGYVFKRNSAMKNVTHTIRIKNAINQTWAANIINNIHKMYIIETLCITCIICV